MKRNTSTRYKRISSMQSVVLHGILCFAVWTGCSLAGEKEGTIPFSFKNSPVNHAIIKAYESTFNQWQAGQLFLVAVCYVTEQQLPEAQAVLEKLIAEEPNHARALRALGQVYHMQEEHAKAIDFYTRAWNVGEDVHALALLAGLRLQEKQLDQFKDLVKDLIAHQDVDIDIQKVLLSYSIMVEDPSVGGPVYAAVAKSVDQDEIAKNPDLRKLLLMATARYRQGEAGKHTADDAEGHNGAPDRHNTEVR